MSNKVNDSLIKLEATFYPEILQLAQFLRKKYPH